MINKGLYSYTHPLNVKINIFYINYVWEIIDTDSLDKFITELNNNIQKYTGNIWNNYTINIYDSRRDDLPTDFYYTDSVTGAKRTYNGICFPDKMYLNSNETYDNQSLADLLSHEWGHLFSWVNNKNNPLDKVEIEYQKTELELNKDRGSTPNERKADHIKRVLGCSLAQKDRGDFVQGNKIPGLHNMFLLWHRISLFINLIESDQYNGQVINITPHFSTTNLQYFSLSFDVVYPWQKAGEHYAYSVDLRGWQCAEPNQNYKFIQYF